MLLLSLLGSLLGAVVLGSRSSAQRRPITSVAIAAVLIVTIPYWIGISFGSTFVPFSMMALAALIVLCFKRLAFPFPLEAWLVVALLVAATLSTAVRGSDPSDLIEITLVWGGAFTLGLSLAGRVRLNDATRAMCWIAVWLSIWSIVEFALDFHPFSELTKLGGPYDVWAPIQQRGSFSRSEGALGHSIALGNVIAITMPFLIASRLAPVRKVMLIALAFSGIFLTFSRSALLSAVAAIVISLLFMSNRRLAVGTRQLLLALAAAGIGFAVPLYAALVSSASDEVDASTAYRSDYVTVLRHLQLLGPATNKVQLSDYSIGYVSPAYPGGVIKTVDNSVLLAGLQFGIVPMAIFAALVVLIPYRVVRNRSNVALIAAASQTTSVLTFAMITQYAYFYWLILGVAVGFMAIKDHEPRCDSVPSRQRDELSWTIRSASARRARLPREISDSSGRHTGP